MSYKKLYRCIGWNLLLAHFLLSTLAFRLETSEAVLGKVSQNGNWFTQSLHDFHKFKVFKCCWSRSLQLECRGRVCSHWFTKFVDHVCRTSSWVPGLYLNEALPRSHVTLVKGCPQIWMICYSNFAESSVVSRSATIVWDSLRPWQVKLLKNCSVCKQWHGFFPFFLVGGWNAFGSQTQHVKKNMERINILSEAYLGPWKVSWETSIFWTAELPLKKCEKLVPGAGGWKIRSERCLRRWGGKTEVCGFWQQLSPLNFLEGRW